MSSSLSASVRSCAAATPLIGMSRRWGESSTPSSLRRCRPASTHAAKTASFIRSRLPDRYLTSRSRLRSAKRSIDRSTRSTPAARSRGVSGSATCCCKRKNHYSPASPKRAIIEPVTKPTRRAALSALAACLAFPLTAANAAGDRLILSDDAWRKRLTPEQFEILRRGGTEIHWSSPLEREHRAGVFSCAACVLPLFSSTTKFESGTGWPSFYAQLKVAVRATRDTNLGVVRDEGHCC